MIRQILPFSVRHRLVMFLRLSSQMIRPRIGALLLILLMTVTVVHAQSADPQPTLEVTVKCAQTHVIPAGGRTWNTTNDTSGIPMPSLSDRNFHLVGGRDALVIVESLFLADGVTLASIDTAVLEVYLAGTKQTELSLADGSTLYPSEGIAAETYASTRTKLFWVNLDKMYVKPGLRVYLRALTGTDASKRSQGVDVHVGAPAVLIMTTLPFYLFGANETLVPLSSTAEPDAATKLEYFAKHPFSVINMINHPIGKILWSYVVVTPSGTAPAARFTAKSQQTGGYQIMGCILQILGSIRSANGEGSLNTQTYAPWISADDSGKYSSPGGGLGGGNVGTGDYAYTGVFIHEGGHAYGLPHANDGFVGKTYPYTAGSLGNSGWGFDQHRHIFLPTFLANNSYDYKNCHTDGHQLDSEGRCIKQDPMQGGAGDQVVGDKYTEFSDFNVGQIQRWAEGRITVNRTASSTSPSFTKWDPISQQMLTYTPNDASNKGIYGINEGFPIVIDVPVHAIIFTASIRIQDTYTESGTPRLSYNDTITYEPSTTQIYPPLKYVGNLLRQINPRNATELSMITLNTGTYPWFCQGSGCDYTLRVTYTDSSKLEMVVRDAFRGWFASSTILATAANPNSTDSFRRWAVNVPGDKKLHLIELLETPEVWKGNVNLDQAKVVTSLMVEPLDSTSTGSGADSSTGLSIDTGASAPRISGSSLSTTILMMIFVLAVSSLMS